MHLTRVVARVLACPRLGGATASLAIILSIAGSIPAQAQSALAEPVARAQEQMRSDRYDEAIRLLGDHLRSNPRDGMAAYLRAVSLSRSGRHAAAARAFEAYAAAGGRNPELELEWGMALARSGQPAPALDKLAAFQQANPSRPDVLLAIGEAQMLRRDWVMAESVLKQAYADPALRPKALARLTALENARGNDAKAGRYAQELLRQHPGSPEAKLAAEIRELRNAQKPQ